MTKGPVVLITGTSTGIGRAAAERLHAKGATVVATARKLEDIHDLANAGMDTMALDVTNDDQMASVVDAVVQKHGRIDALVNNAGYGVMLPQEEMPMEKVRQMFEVNVFGLQRMTQLVLPHMRQQGSGRIVNVASVAGHLTLPMMGPYSASKFAVRALTWALKGEVRPFGVKVSLIEPGSIQTEFGNRSVREGADIAIDREGPYAPLHSNWNRLRVGDMGGSVDVIARQIAHACLGRRPRLHYVAPYDAKAGKLISKFFPDALTSRLTAAYLWRDRKNS